MICEGSAGFLEGEVGGSSLSAVGIPMGLFLGRIHAR